MLTPEQIRAARALLNWSQADLAEASGVASQSIKNIERGVTDPRLSTATTIRTTLEKAGVQFLANGDVAGAPGVALRQEGAVDLTRRTAIEVDLSKGSDKLPRTPAGGMERLERARKANVVKKLKNRRASFKKK